MIARKLHFFVRRSSLYVNYQSNTYLYIYTINSVHDLYIFGMYEECVCVLGGGKGIDLRAIPCERMTLRDLLLWLRCVGGIRGWLVVAGIDVC